MLRDPKTNDLVHTVCIDDKSKLNINNPNLVTADGVQLNLDINSFIKSKVMKVCILKYLSIHD